MKIERDIVTVVVWFVAGVALIMSLTLLLSPLSWGVIPMLIILNITAIAIVAGMVTSINRLIRNNMDDGEGRTTKEEDAPPPR